jgi:farnesyl-diphosphate farnesyltransferase
MEPSIRNLLKRTSRSLFISLKVLPEEVRDAMGLGYLFCRAADTIADTRLVPMAKRLGTLEAYRAAFTNGTPMSAEMTAGIAKHQASESERELLERLGETIELWKKFPAEERELLRRVVMGVTDGMRMDMMLFPGDDASQLKALSDSSQVDQYCAYIGGEPGRFWTDLCLLRVPQLKGADADKLRIAGIRLGKGLQITNILKDIAKDLRIGRCYIPEADLHGVGLTLRDLLDPGAIVKLRPVLRKWMGWGLSMLDAGADYVEAMPTLRLRAAAAWPLLLSLKTLTRVAKSDLLLRQDRAVKVPRQHVYGMMLGTPWTLSSNTRFRKRFNTLRDRLAVEIQESAS